MPLATRLLIGSAALATILCAGSVGAQLPVVTYHCHENLGWTQAQYQWHSDFYNANGYNTITMEQFWNWYSKGDALPPRPLLITVDDNYIKNYTEMWSILKANNQIATNFVISTNALGGGLPSCDYAKLREMELSGHFLSESHTQTHPYLAELTQIQQRTQLQGSRTKIETELGKEVRFLAYPYGSYNSVTISENALAGYYAAFVYNSSKNAPEALVYRDSPAYELERLAVDHCVTEQQLKTKIGFLAALPTAASGFGWTCDDTECAALFDKTAWTVMTPSAGAYGSTLRTKAAANAGQDFVWQTVLPKAGQYKIHANWSASEVAAPNAEYTVTADNALKLSVTKNQQVSDGWNQLGKVTVVNTGQTVTVMLLDKGTGMLTADAVWFEWLGATPDAAVSDWELF